MIYLNSVTEEYNLKFIRHDYLKEDYLLALNNISLQIKQGELINIIGENGSGKTTLLKIIAGFIDPSKGTVDVKGKVAVIMDLGSSFHPDLTGRENILASAPLYGLSQNEAKKLLPLIEEFAELDKFFDAPIRTYSHGMYLRLAFSYALNIDPDILLIDDIITVGDEKARYKCFNKIEELKNSNKTIILVTHDLNFAKNFAPKTLWLKEGKLFKEGNTNQIIDEYRACFPFNNNNYSYLLSPRINSNHDNPSLFFRDLNLLYFKYLTINIANYKKDTIFTFIKKDIIEVGNHFIKIIFHFEYNLKILFIFNIEELDVLKFEIFLQSVPFNWDYNLKLALEIFWNIRFDISKTSSQIKYFNNVFFNSWSKDKHLSLDGTITPVPLTVKSNNDSKSLSIQILVPHTKNSHHEHRILTFKTKITKEKQTIKRSLTKLSEQLSEQTIQNKTKTINCLFCNGIYEIKYKDKSLFKFKGIEFLFNYKEKLFSSNQATHKFIRKNENQNLINYYQESWPFKISLKMTLSKSTCNIIVYITDCIEDIILDNFILQILWDDIFSLDSTNSFKGAPLYLTNTDAFTLKISKPDKDQVWLLSHKYKNQQDSATVTYLLKKQLICNQELSCLICFDDFKNKTNVNKVDFSTSFITFKDGVINTKKESSFIMPYHYLSVFSSPTWHDSLTCLWQNIEGNIFEGMFPWLPIKLKIEVMETDTDTIKISYALNFLKNITMEKIQLTFPINTKEFEIFCLSFLEPNKKKLLINNSSSIETIKNTTLFAGLSNDYQIYLENKEICFAINGNMLDKNFILTIEQIRNKGIYLNLTILCNPIEFSAGKVDLGSIKITKIKEKK